MTDDQSRGHSTTPRTPKRKAANAKPTEAPRFVDVTEQKRLQGHEHDTGTDQTPQGE